MGNPALHLITGGSGLLGFSLARELRNHGIKVRILDLKPPRPEILPQVEFFQGSVLDPRAAEKAAQGCETVHHLAASLPQARLSPEKYHQINVGGTMTVAEAAVKNRVRRMVFASTIEIYGLHYPEEFPLREDAETRFTGPYSRNKWECEQRLLEIRERSGLEVVFPRMPMIFGPGFNNEWAVMAMFRLLRRGLPLPVMAWPQAPWAVVGAADAAAAFRLCAETPQADGEAMNIAAPDAPPCKQVLEELVKKTGSRSKVVQVPISFTKALVALLERAGPLSPTPPELVRFALTGGVYSIEKARRLIGYDPKQTAVEAMLSAFYWLYPEARPREEKPGIDRSPGPSQ